VTGSRQSREAEAKRLQKETSRRNGQKWIHRFLTLWVNREFLQGKESCSGDEFNSIVGSK